MRLRFPLIPCLRKGLRDAMCCPFVSEATQSMQNLVEENEVVITGDCRASQRLQRSRPLTVESGGVGLRCRAGQVPDHGKVRGLWSRVGWWQRFATVGESPRRIGRLGGTTRR